MWATSSPSPELGQVAALEGGVDPMRCRADTPLGEVNSMRPERSRHDRAVARGVLLAAAVLVGEGEVPAARSCGQKRLNSST